jgi:tripartite-type tricarboxylate transporter receptor subunit TctC
MIQNMTRRQVLLSSLAFSTAFFVSDRSATALSYPTKPIRLLVGGAAGSVPDTVARVIADRLSPRLGQPVVVENRPGAGGTLAIIGLIGSEPDGHTLALATMSQAVFNRYLYSKLPYDPQRDLEPVAPLATGAMAVAAHPSFAATTFSEFVAIAAAQPDKVLVATTQVGSPPYVFSLFVARATGVKVTLNAKPNFLGSQPFRKPATLRRRRKLGSALLRQHILPRRSFRASTESWLRSLAMSIFVDGSRS